MNEEILIALATIFVIPTGIFFILYKYLSSIHEQRMAYIDRGGDLSDLVNKKYKNPLFLSRIPFVLVGLGLGLLVGLGLNEIIRGYEPLCFFIPVLIFLGLSLLAHFWFNNMRENNANFE